MNLFIKTLLVWLLMLAVSAQSAAAATMAFCGPDHHGTVDTQVQSAAPAEHAHHDSAATTPHPHDGVTDLAEEDLSGSASFATSAKVGDPGTHKCSACASCCSVGAILSAALAVPAPVFTPTVFATVVPCVDTFAADGPDRPPRIVHA